MYSNMYTKLVIYLLFISPFVSAKTTYPDITISSVVSVYDGDTIKVNIANYPDVIGEAISIRIRGIDAPENRSKCTSEKAKAIKAKDYLKALLANAGVIRLTQVERGKYFRLVANVLVDGVNINQLMIDQGLARTYDGMSKRETWCN